MKASEFIRLLSVAFCIVVCSCCLAEEIATVKPKVHMANNGQLMICLLLSPSTKDVDGKPIELFKSGKPVKLIAKFKGYDVNKRTDVVIRTVMVPNFESKRLEHKTFENGAEIETPTGTIIPCNIMWDVAKDCPTLNASDIEVLVTLSRAPGDNNDNLAKMQEAGDNSTAKSVRFNRVTEKSITVKQVQVRMTPHWPFDGKFDIKFTVDKDIKDDDGNPVQSVILVATQKDTNDEILEDAGLVSKKRLALRTISVNGGEFITFKDAARVDIKKGMSYTIVWDATKDGNTLKSTLISISLDLPSPEPMQAGDYMVVDLETGAVRHTTTPPDLSDDTCRMKELWLRRIPAGKFTMGSPEDELGRDTDQLQLKVTLTTDFYIGIFEMTQWQYELVTGQNPSYFNNIQYYATRPVESVSYQDIRGDKDALRGYTPAGHDVDSRSFLGKLRKLTKLEFELPTEAQWEYACRAGTKTSFNSGKNLESNKVFEACPYMSEVGRYNGNCGRNKGSNSDTSYGTARVGSYKPNAWGLYDMHGNVREWCLGKCLRKNESDAKVVNVDPRGTSFRMIRGGCYSDLAASCTSATINDMFLDDYSLKNNKTGFRVVCPVVNADGH